MGDVPVPSSWVPGDAAGAARPRRSPRPQGCWVPPFHCLTQTCPGDTVGGAPALNPPGWQSLAASVSLGSCPCSQVPTRDFSATLAVQNLEEEEKVGTFRCLLKTCISR